MEKKLVSSGVSRYILPPWRTPRPILRLPWQFTKLPPIVGPVARPGEFDAPGSTGTKELDPRGESTGRAEGVRDSLAAILPGLADMSIQRPAELRPAGWAAPNQFLEPPPTSSAALLLTHPVKLRING